MVVAERNKEEIGRGGGVPRGKLEERNPRFPGASLAASNRELPLSLAGGLHLPWPDVLVREEGGGDLCPRWKDEGGEPSDADRTTRARFTYTFAAGL